MQEGAGQVGRRRELLLLRRRLNNGMPRNEPQRSCLSCRKVKNKSALLRFVLAPDRTLVADLQAKLPGRGAYTCLAESCLRAAAVKKQFARAFKGEVRCGTPDELAHQVTVLMEERIAGYLALANKAGKVVSGGDSVTDVLSRHSPGYNLHCTGHFSRHRAESCVSRDAGRCAAFFIV